MKITIELPSSDQILEVLQETYRVESIIDNYIENAIYHADGTIRINGVTHYKWTQHDYGDPIAYESFIYWEYRPNNSCWQWDFEDANHYKANDPNLEQYIRVETSGHKNFKDVK